VSSSLYTCIDIFFIYRLYGLHMPGANKNYSPEEHAELDSYERSKASHPSPSSFMVWTYEAVTVISIIV